MSARFHSDQWYRVAGLKPAMCSHVGIHRHRYRGDAWYVLQDRASERMIRISAATARVVGRFDGSSTIDEIWKELLAQPGWTPPAQDEIVDILARAHAADMVRVDLPPEVSLVAQRRGHQKSARFKSRWLNPLSMRVPLVDPDGFLSRTKWLAGPLFGVAGVLIWFCGMVAAVVVASMHWSDLTANWSDRILSLENAALMAVIYAVVKALHELGHGYAIKRFGGEVHQMGVMFIYLMPVPYVEASAANAFPNKWQRVLVSLAGIIVETWLAAIALVIWLAAEPGIVRAVAFNVMVICGFSTVLFNGNPLMRYDGYFALADALEMPNLAQRSAAFWLRAIQRHVLRMGTPATGHVAQGERAWLMIYQLASVPYRIWLSVAIALWLARDFFFVGVLTALWIFWSSAVRPIVRGVWFVLTDARLNGGRTQAAAVVLVASAVLGGLVTLLPVSMRKTLEGVIWLPEDAQVRVGEEGFLRPLLVPVGSRVRAGDAVLISSDAALEAEVGATAARVQELEIEYQAQLYSDRVAAALTREELSTESARLDRLRERQARLIARAGVAGTLTMARPGDMEGRYAKKGELVGFILNGRATVVRLVVEQNDINLVRSRLVSAQVRVAGRLSEIYPTRIIREVPEALHELPSPALALSGGGTLAYDPQHPDGAKALERIFQFDLALDPHLGAGAVGTRVYVRLVFEPESLASYGLRRVRQLFLSRLSV